jgi:hypothetical protein
MRTKPSRVTGSLGLIALVAAGLAGCSSGPTDASAIADQLFADSGVAFMTGPADVAAITDFGQRQISRQEYQDMLCAAKAGFLRFTRDDGSHIETEPTAKGEAATRAFLENDWSRAEQRKNSTAHFIKLAAVELRVERVVEDKTIEKSADRYRVIGVRARSRLTDIGADLHNACDAMKISPFEGYEQNWRLLVKWDPFSSKWKLVTQDSAPSDRDLPTDNVGEALARLGA